MGDAGCSSQAACSLPPSGRDWLKTPSMVSQELPSPPHTRHLSSFASEPSTRSQPTCWRKKQQGISCPPAGALSPPRLAAPLEAHPWAPPHSPPLHHTPGSAQQRHPCPAPAFCHPSPGTARGTLSLSKAGEGRRQKSCDCGIRQRFRCSTELEPCSPRRTTSRRHQHTAASPCEACGSAPWPAVAQRRVTSTVMVQSTVYSAPQ